MFRDEKTGKDFAGSQNPWLKRLGLFFLIIGCTAPYWKEHTTAFSIILIVIVVLAVIWGVMKIFVGDIKDLFNK